MLKLTGTHWVPMEDRQPLRWGAKVIAIQAAAEDTQELLNFFHVDERYRNVCYFGGCVAMDLLVVPTCK